MANPQKENGNTQIANEILEKMSLAKLNGTEFATVLVVIRKTYGWNKKEDAISLTQFEKATGASRPAICKALKKLQLVNILLLVNNRSLGINVYSFNKDFDTWVVNKPLLVNKSKSTSKQIETEVVNKPLHTKDILTKDIIQKTSKSENKFSDDSVEMKLSKLLQRTLKANYPALKEPNLQKWSKVIDKIIRIDKIKPEKIALVIRLTQGDSENGIKRHEFWWSVVRSPEGLRRNWDSVVTALISNKK